MPTFFTSSRSRYLLPVLFAAVLAMTAHAAGRREDRDGDRKAGPAREQVRPRDARSAPEEPRGVAGDNPGNVFPQGQRNSKLTPDERRALRRQINEAGHDIYSPRR